MQIRIGTRNSKLALWQANLVADLLVEKGLASKESIKIVPIITSGDKITNKPLYYLGGKGLFIKEIEEALLAEQIDIAVHSLKDIPAYIPTNLEIVATLKADDYRDALVSSDYKSIFDIPAGAKIGTSSPRRIAIVKHLRSDLKIVNIRGNVDSRIQKQKNAECDALILAAAALKRISTPENTYTPISEHQMLPAVGQGVIALEIRKNNQTLKEALMCLNHEQTWQRVVCERAFIEELNANCQIPIAGLANITGEKIFFKGMLAAESGAWIREVCLFGAIKEAKDLGKEAALKLLA
jgi:hydroxymethylbilane synthase